MNKKTGAVCGKLVRGNPLYDQELERAPWEIESENYYQITSPELIAKSLEVIRRDHVLLVLASPDGQRYGNTILIDFDQETLNIDKPDNFDEKAIDVFQVYFKDILGVWSYFPVRTVAECNYTLCATYPDTLYRLQRRRYHRVALPRGTSTFFREEDQVWEGAFVKDLSAGGMLICTGDTEDSFPLNAVIKDITITLPSEIALQVAEAENQVVLPVIKKGRIVRTFMDSDNDLLCHGVAFETDAELRQELVRCLEIILDSVPVGV